MTLRAQIPLLVGLLVQQGAAQQAPFNPVYLDTSVAIIHIWIHPDSLALMYRLDSLESDHEYPAEFTFENGALKDSVSRIGFRLRGNTSRNSKKKSFKVSFNTFVSGRSFHGLEKLNLNGEHNDPSIARSKLSWDLFNDFGVAGSRSHYARVHINNRYYGLYVSVEHVDENFALARFGNNNGNLYKCLWPAALTYRGPTGASYNAIGSDSRYVYELQTNKDLWDYSDLAGFITFLNRSSDSTFGVGIETRLNVPAFLKALAVDVAVGSWDDYWFNQNNFYLYHNTTTGRFEFIPYDVDNTFGIWWTSILPGVNWGTRSVLEWGHPTESRPLTQRLLANARYNGWYRYFLMQLLQRHFVVDQLTTRTNAIHAMITQAAEADSFRTLDYGYSVSQFHASFTAALGAHVPYGILPYISTRRTTALQQLTLPDISPIITRQGFAVRGDTAVTISADVEDEAAGLTVTAIIYPATGAPHQVALWDDGAHGDGHAGDGLYAGEIRLSPPGSEVHYAIRAQDATGNVSLDPSTAPGSTWRVPALFSAGPLVINEFMASNSMTMADPWNEFDDWIEICNSSASPVALHGKYVTDNLTRPDKWMLPDTTIAPGGIFLVWADGQTAQGKWHASFKLDKEGEGLGIFDSTSSGLVVFDSLTYGVQGDDISLGRLPNGTGQFVPMHPPTPGVPNNICDVPQEAYDVPNRMRLSEAFPNPFNPNTTIEYSVKNPGRAVLAVYDLLGREVARLMNEVKEPGTYRLPWDASGMASGVYICRLSSGGMTESKKLLLLR